MSASRVQVDERFDASVVAEPAMPVEVEFYDDSGDPPVPGPERTLSYNRAGTFSLRARWVSANQQGDAPCATIEVGPACPI